MARKSGRPTRATSFLGVPLGTLNKILKEDQWYSRNACIVTKTHVEATEGDQIYYTLNNTRYIQGLRKWRPIL